MALSQPGSEDYNKYSTALSNLASNIKSAEAEAAKAAAEYDVELDKAGVDYLAGSYGTIAAGVKGKLAIFKTTYDDAADNDGNISFIDAEGNAKSIDRQTVDTPALFKTVNDTMKALGNAAKNSMVQHQQETRDQVEDYKEREQTIHKDERNNKENKNAADIGGKIAKGTVGMGPGGSK